MNTFPTLYDHAVLGAHRPHDPLAPCERNVATVAQLRVTLARIATLRAPRPLPRLVSFEAAREKLLSEVRKAS